MRRSSTTGTAHEEPVSFVHDTEDGRVHLLALPDKEGGWKALLWGTQLAGGQHFKTLVKANAHLLRSFREMFPDHTCTARCRNLGAEAQQRAAVDMNFRDYSDD